YSNLLTYDTVSFGVCVVYMITPETMLNLGYSDLTRKYDDPCGIKTKSHTISACVAHKIVKKVYVNVGYGRQFNDSNVSNTDHNNNIYTLGVTFSF
ncbi:hypothetical protein HKBW3S42_01205, partial [Candidatus Hakubella thermalkaliphila]